MHHELQFRFNCLPWAYEYGLAMRAYADWRDHQDQAPWDTLDDLVVGLAHAGYDNAIVDKMLRLIKEKNLSVMDMLPQKPLVMKAPMSHMQSGDKSFIVTQVVAGPDIRPSLSCIVARDMGSDQTLFTVGLSTLAVVGSNTMKLEKAQVLPRGSTVTLELQVRDIVPPELHVSLVGVLTQDIM